MPSSISQDFSRCDRGLLVMRTSASFLCTPAVPSLDGCLYTNCQHSFLSDLSVLQILFSVRVVLGVGVFTSSLSTVRSPRRRCRQPSFVHVAVYVLPNFPGRRPSSEIRRRRTGTKLPLRPALMLWTPEEHGLLVVAFDAIAGYAYRLVSFNVRAVP